VRRLADLALLSRTNMLTPLEKAVIDTLLEKKGEPFDTIRRQMAHAQVTNREFTGVGFFTEFSLPKHAEIRRDLPDSTIGNVTAEFPGLQHGAGFLLFIRNGVVTMLEGYTYDEPWPAHIDEFRVYTDDTA
jgi:hypothetical protein